MDIKNEERLLRAIDSLNLKYGLRLDAKKVLKKISGKRPGKRCKGGWISADKQCSDHKKEGKLTEAGKASARELAEKVRKRKGMKAIKNASGSDVQVLPELKGTEKQVKWAKELRAAYIEQADRYIDRRLASIEKRVKDPDRVREAKQEVWEDVRDKHIVIAAQYAASFIDRMKNRNFDFADPGSGQLKQEMKMGKEVPESYRNGTWIKDNEAFHKELKDRGLTDFAPEYAKPYL